MKQTRELIGGVQDLALRHYAYCSHCAEGFAVMRAITGSPRSLELDRRAYASLAGVVVIS